MISGYGICLVSLKVIRKDATKKHKKHKTGSLNSGVICAFLWRDLNRAWRSAIAFDRDAPNVSGKRVVSHSFGPLDYQHRSFITQKVVEIDGVSSAGAFVEPIEIDVEELQTSRVRVYEREGWTCNVLFCDA
jgi:hypothetical protein